MVVLTELCDWMSRIEAHLAAHDGPLPLLPSRGHGGGQSFLGSLGCVLFVSFDSLGSLGVYGGWPFSYSILWLFVLFLCYYLINHIYLLFPASLLL